MPGRGRRRGEPPAEDARALATDLLARLPIGDRGDGLPYALFGACLGGIIAYELAAASVAAGDPPPLLLAVGPVSPPDLYAEAVAKL
jgi:surfactin synthase thioesterase subunit